jgi:hypothetical protein
MFSSIKRQPALAVLVDPQIAVEVAKELNDVSREHAAEQLMLASDLLESTRHIEHLVFPIVCVEVANDFEARGDFASTFDERDQRALAGSSRSSSRMT